MDSTLQLLKEFIEDSNKTNSNTDKLNVVKQYAKYPEVVKAFDYVYSPFKQYYVTSENCIKNSNLRSAGDTEYQTIFALLDSLASRVITGHTAISKINTFVEINNDYADIIWMILDRNLKTRSTASMINKAIPGCIPEFEVALAGTYNESTSAKINWKDGYYVSKKIDGCLEENSIIELEDGRSLTIKEIVDNKIHCNVKSYNVLTNTIEYKPVIDWMVNLDDINQDNTEWFEIELENGKKIKLTGNHRVWIPELMCWRRTDELDGTELLLIN